MIGCVFLLTLALSGCLFPSSNRPPVLDVTALPREGYAPLEVDFSASGSFDPEGRPLTYRWEFGDGESAVGLSATHAYSSAGIFTATLTGIDPDGAETKETVSIDVREVPSGHLLRRLEWVREESRRVWDLLIPYELYQTYKGRVRNPFIDNYLYGDYVTDPLDDPTLEDYADALWNRVGGHEMEFIHEALAFVQGAIAYRADPPGTEHPLYPLETLTDGLGDCEDTAILFVSLLRAKDIPSKLAFVDTGGDGTPDHVLAFVAIPASALSQLACSVDVTAFEWDDQTYALAETAVDQGVYGLGCDPWGLDEGDIAELWSFPEF